MTFVTSVTQLTISKNIIGTVYLDFRKNMLPDRFFEKDKRMGKNIGAFLFD